jgi:hypothetical protein
MNGRKIGNVSVGFCWCERGESNPYGCYPTGS